VTSYISLDNRKIKIDERKVDQLLAAESVDLTSILLTADAFVTNRTGRLAYRNPE